MPTSKSSTGNPADFTLQEEESGELIIFFKGDLDKRYIGSLWAKLDTVLKKKKPSDYVFDFSQLTRFDTAGMALIRTLENRCSKKGTSCHQRNLPEEISHFFRYASRQSAAEAPESSPSPGIIERLGIWGKQRADLLYEAFGFIMGFVVTAAASLRRPRRIQISFFFMHLQKVGAEAVPIVIALSALLGLVIVFQGLATSNQLGSKIFIADMVVISVTKQMAPIITAIIIAGRSGAAFAAEIGSMKIRQELDVLSVMNFDITGFLVLPRVLAMVVAAPLLTMLSDLAGIIGGLLTSMVVVDLSAIRFITEVRHALSAPAIYTGLIKGAGFGFLIGMAGCFHGLRTRNTADSVGVETTSAVVTGILFIILADALFAALFSRFGW